MRWLASPWARWGLFTALGVGLGELWLSAAFEPMAKPIVYRFLQSRQDSPGVRFIDVGPLYERNEGRQPTAQLTRLLRDIARLPASIRPKVVAIDLPILRASPVSDVVFGATHEQLKLLHVAWCLDRGIDPDSSRNPFVAMTDLAAPPPPPPMPSERVRMRIGVASVRMSLDFLEDKLPGVRDLFATAFLYKDERVASTHLGTGDERLPSLGIAAANAVPGAKPAFTPAYRQSPPGEWKHEVVAAPTWMLVNYSLYPHFERLTVPAGGGVGDDSILASGPIARLRRAGPAPIWFIGKTRLDEAEDTTMVSDERSWRGEDVAVRRVYQHGAIAHSYLESPIRPFPKGWQLVVDVAVSMLAFLLVPRVIALGRGGPSLLRSVVLLASLLAGGILTVFVAFLLAFALSVLWLGFFGNVVYSLVESFYLTLFEQERKSV